jgi:DNA-binding transcriptional ArsR family regulator
VAGVDPAGAIFEALADPTRRRLLSALAARGAATATALAADLPISRQAVLKHLTALRDAGLVEGRRQGREVRYGLTPAPLADAVSWIAAVGAQWDGRLAALARHLGSRDQV